MPEGDRELSLRQHSTCLGLGAAAPLTCTIDTEKASCSVEVGTGGQKQAGSAFRPLRGGREAYLHLHIRGVHREARHDHGRLHGLLAQLPVQEQRCTVVLVRVQGHLSPHADARVLCLHVCDCSRGKGKPHCLQRISQICFNP